MFFDARLPNARAKRALLYLRDGSFLNSNSTATMSVQLLVFNAEKKCFGYLNIQVRAAAWGAREQSQVQVHEHRMHMNVRVWCAQCGKSFELCRELLGCTASPQGGSGVTVST